MPLTCQCSAAALSEGTHHFNALKHCIPDISHRELTITLRGLERDGLVAHKAYATVPRRRLSIA
ncbi:winged helix-turn-helix transcriptional regulator [Acinetobacter baumannii]